MTGEREVIIEEHFGGQIEYINKGMRHQEETETFLLEKGDRVIIIKKVKEKK